MANRKSKPWAVELTTGTYVVRTEHTSEAKAYQHVLDTTAAVTAGQSDVTRIRVEQWEPDPGRWAHYEDIHPNT